MKHIIASICIALMLSLIGGSVLAEAELSPDEERVKYAAVERISDGALLYIGMPRSDAEQIVGAEDISKSKGKLIAYDDITIAYRDGAICGIALGYGENESSDYMTAAGAKVGSSKSELKDMYGQYLDTSSDDLFVVRMKFEIDRWNYVADLAQTYGSITDYAERDKRTVGGVYIHVSNEIATGIEVADERFGLDRQ